MAGYLLDTHTLLWAMGEPEKLSPQAYRWISAADNRIFVSIASLWELSIKVSIGKLQVPEEFFTGIAAHGYEILQIRETHLTAYRSLPLLHRDPFDRLLIAQAHHENLPLLTCDPDIAKYDVRAVW
jgi:PIN domain nuclease of toxin-antitoxin system